MKARPLMAVLLFCSNKNMSSIRCPKCNLTNWVQATVCKRCGGDLVDTGTSISQAANAAPYNEAGFESRSVTTGQYSNPYSLNAGQPLKTGLALTSMIIGIFSIPTTVFLLGMILAPVSLVFGIVALVKSSKRPSVYGGRGFAVAGVITSAVALVVFTPIMAAVLIPNVLAAKRNADELSAMSTLRTLFAAESTYMFTEGNGSCADLTILASRRLIKSEWATGTKDDFRFEVVMDGSGKGCEIFATPVSKYARSFMVSQDGVIRGANKKGARATKNDVPISN